MLILLPTDTCYGIAGEFTHTDYDEIYRLKGRDFSKPLALLVRDYEDMRAYIEISDAQITFLQKYPHPWSFLGKRKSSFSLPGYMSSEQYTQISLRVAENCINANIRDNIKYPLFLTSANTSGHLESSTLEGARAYFPQIDGFDGGMCNSLPSDIFSIDEEGDLYYLRKNYSL